MRRSLPFVVTATLIIASLIFPVTPVVYSGAAGDPALLSFDELIALYENKTLPAPLAGKLDHLLGTPFVDNGAATNKAEVPRTSSPQIRPVLRVAHWNIERGLAFEDI